MKIAIVLAVLFVGCTREPVEVYRLNKGKPLSFQTMVSELRAADVVVIGEVHDSTDHHLLQYEIIQALHENGVPIAIGLEMFRSDDQRTLDAWVAGDLETDRFVARYYRNWKIPWPFYRDIFLYAREHRIPLVGLNIPDAVTEAVAKKGFGSLTAEQRARIPAGVTCNVDPRYRAFIRKAYSGHSPAASENFDHFCEAQLLWDQSMALRIAGFREEHQHLLIVALAGIGHAQRQGIPRYLTDYAKLTSRIVLPRVPGELEPTTATMDDADYLVIEFPWSP